jgi:hypothetical protein
MLSVTFVVTNIELVIVHFPTPTIHPKMKQAAGGVGSLFGLLMTSDLAVFQKIILDSRLTWQAMY